MLGVTITTIQTATECVKKLYEKLEDSGIEYKFILTGDRKSSPCYGHEGVRFISIDEQLNSNFSLAKLMPENHYARKNIGFLYLMQQGVTHIYETDDDNKPNENWKVRLGPFINGSVRFPEKKGWVNVLSGFTEKLIWPRGLPLTEIRNTTSFVTDSSKTH